MFVLPRGVTGFGVDSPQSEVDERRRDFIAWAQAVGASLESAVFEIPLTSPKPSFDVAYLDRVDRWLLHNRFVPLVGLLTCTPEPGPCWAVAGEYVDMAMPEHVTTWGPGVVPAADLNGPLNKSLDALGAAAIAQADNYKPATVGHVIFNYWT